MTTTLSSTHVTDIVPEFVHYEDTGCEVSQACLNCPLPQSLAIIRCIYE